MLSLSWLTLAQDTDAVTQPGGGGWMETLFFFGLIFVVFYFLILRPQKKREQQRRALLERVKKGDKVRTIGGVYGEVTSVKEKFVLVCIDKQSGTTVKLNRAAIHAILGDEGEEDESES